MFIRDPSCPICSKPIKAGSLVLFQHGELFHVACVSRLSQRRARELADGSAGARARAASNVERAIDLVGAAKRLRRSACAVCRRPLWETSGGGYVRGSDGKAVHVHCPARKPESSGP
jgi:hypothetical protein